MIVKSVFLVYSSKVFTFFVAYYFQVMVYFLVLLIKSQPKSVNPIPYIKMVVDCILVDPAIAMLPTFILILWMRPLSMNFLDL